MSTTLHIWAYRALYTVLSIFALAIPLLPLGFSPLRSAMPDLFFALTIAWVVRDSRSAPLVLVALLAILADAVLMRPMGLWAGLIVISSELVRLNERMIREGGFLAELIFFALTLVAMLIVQNLVLLITFAEPYPLPELAQFVVFSVVFYLIIVLALHYVFRLRGRNWRTAPDRLGKIR